VSDREPPIPPPTPGTTSLRRRDHVPSLRPYREEPEIAARERREGRLMHTEQARIARIEAVARDLAAGTSPGQGPLTPAVGKEMTAVMEARVAEEIRSRAGTRTRAEAARSRAQLEVDAAGRREHEAELDARGAHAEVPSRPIGGTHLTSWWMLLVIAPVLVYLEVQLGAPAIGPALAVSSATAQWIAVGIGIGLTIAADALGLVLGGIARHSRRASAAVLASLALALIGCGGWTVLTLTSARTNNIAYRECEKRAEEAQIKEVEGEGSSGLLSLTRTGAQAHEAANAQATAGERSQGASVSCNKPDLGFTAPLTLLAMVAGALLAARAATASEWHDAVRRHAKAQEHHRALARELDAARAAQPDAEQGLAESDEELAVMAEREVDTTAMLLARLVSEYERWCGEFDRPPQPLDLPEIPNPTDLLLRILRLERTPREAPVAESEPQPSPDDAPPYEPPPWSDLPPTPDGEPPFSSWSPPPHDTEGYDGNLDLAGARRRIVSDHGDEQPEQGHMTTTTDDGVPAGWYRDDDDSY
jgi:hypothetical protein